jgi:hypothetical protein
VQPHKRPTGGNLTAEQKADNQVLSRSRILIENCFARWRSQFAAATTKYSVISV